jgi:hypothetical protein
MVCSLQFSLRDIMASRKEGYVLNLIPDVYGFYFHLAVSFERRTRPLGTRTTGACLVKFGSIEGPVESNTLYKLQKHARIRLPQTSTSSTGRF